jgi:hypothetical protein
MRKHPETWNQRAFQSAGPCGTTHCFGGWAITLVDPSWWDDRKANAPGAGVKACELLGLTPEQSTILFFDLDYMMDLESFLREVTAVTGVVFDGGS